MKSLVARKSRIATGHFKSGGSVALGCTTCSWLSECGGFSANGVAFDCSSLCHCESPTTCEHAVCPEKKNEFILRYREVGGFGLNGSGIRAPQAPCVPPYLPVVDSPASRRQPLSYPAVVLPITASIRSGHIASRHKLCEHFLVQPDATVILNGVGQDRQIEPLWNWITSDDFMASVRALQPNAVWTPNFSMFADCPRTNDLHSMKRIAICADRIAAAGVAPVLHLNGRTPHDYRRWRQFLSDSRIELVAFEFHSMSKDRQSFHCSQLCQLARQYDQPLTLFVRGGRTFLPRLADAFGRVIVVDTLALQLARRRHYLADAGTRLRRQKGWSLTSEPVDRFADENVSVSAAFYERHVGSRRCAESDHLRTALHSIAPS